MPEYNSSGIAVMKPKSKHVTPISHSALGIPDIPPLEKLNLFQEWHKMFQNSMLDDAGSCNRQVTADEMVKKGIRFMVARDACKSLPLLGLAATFIYTT
jgi:hypothetical protein